MTLFRLLRKNTTSITINKVFDDSHNYCSMHKCIIVSNNKINTVFLSSDEIYKINKANGHKSPENISSLYK